MSAATPQEQILGIVNNHWQSCCVGAAAQLELADLLAEGPLHVDTLAERTKTHGPSLYRMLRALGKHGNLQLDVARCFWQHAGERMPPPQSGRLELGVDSIHPVCGCSGIRGMARADAQSVKTGVPPSTR